MLTPVQREIALLYLESKAGWSASNDRFLAGAPRAAVPKFATPQDAVHYYKDTHGNPYTGDPLYGALDFYTAPGRLAYALEAGPEAMKHLWIDCDDVAGFYLAACRQIPGCVARIVTLIDSGIKGSHVICVGTLDGHTFGMDTNGYHALADDHEDTLCAHWTAIYTVWGYHYIGALDSPYPFT
jgi:hypothetical protein